jgi:hypothetical protein
MNGHLCEKPTIRASIAADKQRLKITINERIDIEAG